MNSSPPPRLDPFGDPPLESNPSAGLGKLGLRLSLVAPAVFLAFMVLRPG